MTTYKHVHLHEVPAYVETGWTVDTYGNGDLVRMVKVTKFSKEVSFDQFVDQVPAGRLIFGQTFGRF